MLSFYYKEGAVSLVAESMGEQMAVDCRVDRGNSGSPVFLMSEVGPLLLGVAVQGLLGPAIEPADGWENSGLSSVEGGKWLTDWWERGGE